MELVTCPWGTSDALMRSYHDTEWGCPCHDDSRHFEMLVLEGMQAGLSWQCVLNKREAMRAAFDGFNPHVIAGYDAAKVEQLMGTAGIIRNRRKLESLAKNARAFLQIQQEHGSFDAYLWGFVDGEPIVNSWARPEDVPAQTELATRISKDLKRRGCSFVGPTIVYSFMQSEGLVDDHLVNCPCHTLNR